MGFKINSSDHKLQSPISLNINEQDIYNSIKKASYQIHGTIGGAKAMQNFKVKYINVYTGVGYMSSLHQYHKKILSAINFVHSIGSVTANFHTAAQKEIIKNSIKVEFSDSNDISKSGAEEI